MPSRCCRRLVPDRHRDSFLHRADDLAARPQAAVPGDGQPDHACRPIHPFDRDAALAARGGKGLAFDLNRTSFFLSREIVVPKLAPPMTVWREMYFIWMLRNAQSATDYFRIPPERVIELGTLVEI
jgi:hypothetical protein